MQRVEIDILRLRRFAGDTRFVVFGDLGCGEVDFAHPLPPGPQRLWPEAAPRSGHLLDGHVALRHLDSVCPDGHLQTVHVLGEHLRPAWPVVFASPGYVFGRFRHVVRMADAAGNSTSDEPVVAVTVNSSPTRPGDVRCAGYEPAGDQVRITFVPSRFDPLPGN